MKKSTAFGEISSLINYMLNWINHKKYIEFWKNVSQNKTFDQVMFTLQMETLSNVKHCKLHFKCVACKSDVYQDVEHDRLILFHFPCLLFYRGNPCLLFYAGNPYIVVAQFSASLKDQKKSSQSGQWRLIWYQENMRWSPIVFRWI